MIYQKELKNMTDKIKNIQALLLKYFNKNSWQQYIDSQKFGDCKLISYLVSQMCNQFKVVQIEYNFSKHKKCERKRKRIPYGYPLF